MLYTKGCDSTHLGGVHLVDGDDELTDTKGEGKESVFTSLTILGDTGFEFTSTTSNDEDSTIGLGGTSDHVFNEVTVTRGVCEDSKLGNVYNARRIFL